MIWRVKEDLRVEAFLIPMFVTFTIIGSVSHIDVSHLNNLYVLECTEFRLGKTKL